MVDIPLDEWLKVVESMSRQALQRGTETSYGEGIAFNLLATKLTETIIAMQRCKRWVKNEH